MAFFVGAVFHVAWIGGSTLGYIPAAGRPPGAAGAEAPPVPPSPGGIHLTTTLARLHPGTPGTADRSTRVAAVKEWTPTPERPGSAASASGGGSGSGGGAQVPRGSPATPTGPVPGAVMGSPGDRDDGTSPGPASGRDEGLRPLMHGQ